MVYDAAYQNEQANSGPFRAHLGWVADLVFETMDPQSLIEVGCGKGTFLDMLSDRGRKSPALTPPTRATIRALKRCCLGLIWA